MDVLLPFPFFLLLNLSMCGMNCAENAAVSRARSSGGDGIMAKQRDAALVFQRAERA